MTNPTDPGDFSHEDPIGGMLRFLSVGAAVNNAPILMDDTATVVEGRTVIIDVLGHLP